MAFFKIVMTSISTMKFLFHAHMRAMPKAYSIICCSNELKKVYAIEPAPA